MISSSPMSNCFFCGPGEAESMIYVESKEALEYNHRPLKMKGTFKLISDARMGIIYELENATPVQ